MTGIFGKPCIHHWVEVARTQTEPYLLQAIPSSSNSAMAKEVFGLLERAAAGTTTYEYHCDKCGDHYSVVHLGKP